MGLEEEGAPSAGARNPPSGPPVSSSVDEGLAQEILRTLLFSISGDLKDLTCLMILVPELGT